LLRRDEQANDDITKAFGFLLGTIPGMKYVDED
jgi:hypothetical protein